MSIALTIPPLGESISEATVAKWLKRVGDAVKADEPIAELETDKITVTLNAPQAGVITSQSELGTRVRVGESIGQLDPSGAATQAAPAATPPPAAAATPPPAAAPTPPPAAAPTPPPAPAAAHAPASAEAARARALSPTMRRMLREQGIDPSVAPAPAAPARPAPSAPAAAGAPSAGPEDVVVMSPLRRRIAERLVQAQHSAAILTTFNEVDMSAVMELRARHQEEFTKKHGIKLGFMSFFARASVEALRSFPGLNAEVRGDSVAYKKYYHVGVAVGSGRGLVVPVLRDVDRLRFADIEKGIAALAQKAKDNKLTLEDLGGGTFTITNGGIYGSMMSTPLLNMPQTGILGMHNIVRRPVAVGDKVEIHPMMYLALSYDHRVVDGREAVSFLVQIKEQLEQPEKLLLGL